MEVEKIQNQHERSDSTSTLGSSTIASSAAAEAYLLQQRQLMWERQQAEAAKYSQDGVNNTQTNIVFGRNEGISIIYNEYKNDDKNKKSHKKKFLCWSVSDKVFEGGKRRRNAVIAALVIVVIVAISATATIAYLLLRENDFETSHPPGEVYMVNRDEWGADPPKAGIAKLSLPIKRIIVAHTGGSSCFSEMLCRQIVKAIQTDNSHLDDIPFNFLIGGDERIYVGRGFENEGQHTANVDATEYNSIGIGVAFIGNFESTQPSAGQMRVLSDFLYAYVNDKIHENYRLFAQDDLMNTAVKATALKRAIFEQFRERFYELQRIYRREEWGASPKVGQRKVDRILDWVMLSHTVTNACYTVTACSNILQWLQQDAINERVMEDISFNFLLGNNGLIFEGRGWDLKPEHTTPFNSFTIGIAAIGNFESLEPEEQMLDALLRLMDEGAALGKLTADYRVNGRSDVGYAGPGDAFMKHVEQWCRWGNRTTPCD